MPVSTRSKKSSTQPRNDPGQENSGRRPPDNCHQQEETDPPRNPQDGLKQKMKALTLLYEQHKRALRDKEPRFSTQPSVDLNASSNIDGKTKPMPNACHVAREDTLSNPATRLPPPRPIPEDSKQNEIVGFSCPKEQITSSAVSRKLSIGTSVVPRTERRGPNKENPQQPESLGAGRSRILVFVRLRPMAKKERQAGSKCCVRIVNKRDVYLAEFSNENDYLKLKRLRGRHFMFDASFPDSTPQLEIYATTTAEVVEAVLKGRNGSVFCYGATGAGKTYTMLGTVENPGVMVLAIKDLFSKIRQRSSGGHHAVHLSYLEVYNETVRDLLSPGRPLILREDKQGIVAAGLTHYRAHSSDEVMALLQQGNLNRTTEPTRANETSSRSHAILQVAIEYQVRDAPNNIVSRVGKLSLIDLAGSERALATDQRTLRSLEGASINKSLLALSSCINALVEGKKHIPYRNSKLTQLLKDSLGGACNTVMIANISPSSLSFGETQNTLHWADRAKQIRVKGCDVDEEVQMPNSETDQAKLLLELQKENRELRMELARQQQKLLTIQAQALAAPASPATTSVYSFSSPNPSSYQPNEKRKPRSPLLAGNCFATKSKGKADRELSETVKALEAEIERVNKDHALQMKRKDKFISELSRKVVELGGERVDRVVTQPRLGKKKTPDVNLKRPGQGFLSPAPTAKKRSFWDITTANSPSVVTLTGRKTRSHLITGPAAVPSMIPQPGFARPRAQTMKLEKKT